MRIGFVIAMIALGGCKKAPSTPAATDGWIQHTGWAGACFFPKDWGSLGPGDRRLARQATLEAMMSQWTGKRNDGVSFDENVTTDVETVLLGRPEKIEQVSIDNAKMCSDFMASTDSSAWASWLKKIPDELTVGECGTPLVDTWFNYLDLSLRWQNKAGVCAGNVVIISASEIDYFRISPKGPWINAAGDETMKTSGKESYPCNVEGCLAGQMVMRFVGESGIEQVHPVGLKYTFTAPENGTIEVMINDDNLMDNQYKVESGLEHHTSITYAPG
jgi:hypothetical protein